MTWEEVRLGEIVSIGRGSSPRPIADQKYFENGSIPWIKIADATASGKYIYETRQHVNEYGALFSRILKPGSLILAASGTLGFPKILGVKGCIHDGWLYFFNYNGIEKDYLYYLLITLKDYFYSMAYGAAIQNINTDILRYTDVYLPDIDTQKRIVEKISTYDDLIENNQKQIKLLEEAAMRIYKEWFVHFRFPGHETTPIVNGVPDGWEKTEIGEVCQTIGGGTPSTKNLSFYEGGHILWVTPTDITRNNCIVILDTEKKITDAGLNGSSAKLLPPETILMTSRASVGYFGLCEREVCTNQGFISCIPNNENTRMFLLYNLINRTDEIRQKAGGATYLEISKSTFRSLDILLPNDKTLSRFQENIYPLIKEIRLLKKLIENSQQARDKLLPKLMSGEIEVEKCKEI